MARGTSTGFSLIEIAVVLLIVGLLIGAMVKGQELMTAARARSLIRDQDDYKAAFLGFSDRFRALPGDYAQAATTITGVSTVCGLAGNLGNGNGNHRIELAGGEFLLVWDHLAKSGLLPGTYACTGNTAVEVGTAPRNPYGGFLQLIHDRTFAGEGREQHNLKTGPGIPSHILAEIDRKVDDGLPLQGIYRGSTYTTGTATDPTCWDAKTGQWTIEIPPANCGAALLF